MIAEIGRFAGEWCDVDYSPVDGAFMFARLEQPGRVIVTKTTFSAWVYGKYLDIGRWGLYLRAAADGQGNVCVVLQDGRDRNPETGQFYPAIVVLFPRDGSPREIACPAGPAFGQNAVEVVRAGYGWTVYVALSDTTYWYGWLSEDGRWLAAQSATWAATSQGFADAPQRMDDVRNSVPGMVCPSTVGGLSIGQAGEPDRIRGLHQGVYFTVLAGAGFEPHLASDGQGRWMACARTPQGAARVALAAPFEPEPRPPEPPVGLPDQPFVVDPTGVVEDVAAWLFSPDQGPDVHLSPDGRVRFFCKSDERSGDGPDPEIGEHWDLDDRYIGHLEDSSTGRRILDGQEVIAEDIVRRFPDTHAEVWAGLKLNRNTFADGRRLWMPRRCVSGTRLRYVTDITWTVPPRETPHTRVWRSIPVEIRVDVGYGVIGGKEVRVRAAYVPDGNAEVNYYGPPQGFNAWIAGPFPDDQPHWMK